MIVHKDSGLISIALFRSIRKRRENIAMLFLSLRYFKRREKYIKDKKGFKNKKTFIEDILYKYDKKVVVSISGYPDLKSMSERFFL
jgi:hypothetical protein